MNGEDQAAVFEKEARRCQIETVMADTDDGMRDGEADGDQSRHLTPPRRQARSAVVTTGDVGEITMKYTKEQIKAMETVCRLLTVVAKGPPPGWTGVQANEQLTIQEFARDTLEAAGFNWRLIVQ